MRLNIKEKLSIKQSVLNADKDAKVFLFGSRVNDSLKGGDIDLLIISDKINTFAVKSRIRWEIIEQIGDQKIDIIVTSSPEKDPFIKTIMKDSVEL